MSSAKSITAAVNPPRAVYLDYPLGHTAGKAHDDTNQFDIMRDTLVAFTQISAPGTIVDLAYTWQNDDSWKDRVMRPSPPAPSAQTTESQKTSHSDDRTARVDTPQYQNEFDREQADNSCPSCVFLEEQS